MSEWPDWPYPGQRRFPYSIVTNENGKLYFVTCGATQDEAEDACKWLAGFIGNRAHRRAIYHNGKLLREYPH